jgi:hypothetical protein
MTTSHNHNKPEAGTDSRVEDWFGQSVERDAELADRLTAEVGEADAEAEFAKRSDGRAEQQARHGDHIDPDQGRSAYQDGGS